MGVSKGHIKVEDVKKKTEAVVAALNLPIQVILTMLVCRPVLYNVLACR